MTVELTTMLDPPINQRNHGRPLWRPLIWSRNAMMDSFPVTIAIMAEIMLIQLVRIATAMSWGRSPWV